MDNALAMLDQWLGKSVDATVHLVADGSSLSGAAIWKVESAGRAYCLRRWPPTGPDRARIQAIHVFQQILGRVPPQVTPVPVVSQAGETLLHEYGRLWELTNWLPGIADYETAPSEAKLKAAFATLAQLHLASHHVTGSATESYRNWVHAAGPSLDVSPAMRRRKELADWLCAGGIAELRLTARRVSEVQLGKLLERGLRLVELLLDDLQRLLGPWLSTKLPQQWRITDVRREHVLFTGDEVTGVVDFGAADFDSPAGDVARLLGSMAGDNQSDRAAAIAAYVQHRPLSRDELSAVAVFDVSGACLSLANWARWVAEADPPRLSLDTPRIAVRLEQLNARMERLAHAGLAGFAPPL